jgi:hypothetical protein
VTEILVGIVPRQILAIEILAIEILALAIEILALAIRNQTVSGLPLSLSLTHARRVSQKVVDNLRNGLKHVEGRESWGEGKNIVVCLIFAFLARRMEGELGGGEKYSCLLDTCIFADVFEDHPESCP